MTKPLRALALVICLGLCLGGCTDSIQSDPNNGPEDPPAQTGPDISDGTDSPQEPETPSNGDRGPNVHVDWSVLEPYVPDEPVYTRLSDGPMEELIPSDSYGPLIPFLGDKLGGEDTGNRYGLMTLSGEIVLDPVLSNVWDGASVGGYYNSKPLPYYVLTKSTTASNGDAWEELSSVSAMCAKDGSWCTEFKYTMDGELATWGLGTTQNCSEEGLFMLDGDALVYLDGDTGLETLRVENLPEDPGPSMSLWGAGWFGGTPYIRDYGSKGWWIDPETGGLTYTEELPEGTMVNNKFLSYSSDDSAYTVFDENGQALLTAENIQRVTWDSGDQFVIYDQTDKGWTEGYPVTAVYDATTMELVDSPLIGRLVHFVTGSFSSYCTSADWCWYSDGDETVFVRGREKYTVDVPGDPSSVEGRVAVFSDYEGEGTEYLVDIFTGSTMTQYDSSLSFYTFYSYDMATGKLYYMSDTGREIKFFNENCEAMAALPHSPSESISLAGGMFFTTSASQVTLRRTDGDIIFRYLLPSGQWD